MIDTSIKMNDGNDFFLRNLSDSPILLHESFNLYCMSYVLEQHHGQNIVGGISNFLFSLSVTSRKSTLHSL